MVYEWELVLITLATMAAVVIIDLIKFIFRGYRSCCAKIAPLAIGPIQN